MPKPDITPNFVHVKKWRPRSPKAHASGTNACEDASTLADKRSTDKRGHGRTRHPHLHSHSQPANRLVDLGRVGVDAPESGTLVVRERVHRRECDVEARAGVIDREHINALAVVRQLPARPARGIVPARDRRRPADIRELRQRAERAETLRDEPVRAVRARDSRERRASVVVRLVVRDRHRRGEGGGGGSEESESESLELHCE